MWNEQRRRTVYGTRLSVGDATVAAKVSPERFGTELKHRGLLPTSNGSHSCLHSRADQSFSSVEKELANVHLSNPRLEPRLHLSGDAGAVPPDAAVGGGDEWSIPVAHGRAAGSTRAHSQFDGLRSLRRRLPHGLLRLLEIAICRKSSF